MGDFIFESDTLKKYTGPGGDVTVPDGVREIGERAFFGCLTLTSVTVPDGVHTVSYLAFFRCRNLTSVTLPASLENIYYRAFDECPRLKKVFLIGNRRADISAFPASCRMIFAPDILPNRYRKTLRYAMLRGFLRAAENGCPFTEAQTAAYIKYIRRQRRNLYPFAVKEQALLRLMCAEKMIPREDMRTLLLLAEKEHDASLTAQLLMYRHEAFGAAEGADEWENGLGEVGSRMLSAAEAEKDWRFAPAKDGGVRILGYMGTDSTVFVPCGIGGLPVTEIGREAFCPSQYGISRKPIRHFREKIEAVYIPDSVKRIDEAFKGCRHLTSVRLPEGIKYLGDYLFTDCVRLPSVHIPDSVKKIGRGVFADCYRLASVRLPDGIKSLGPLMFDGCESLTSLRIPDSVTKLGNEVFVGCSSLSSLVIPENVKSIGSHAFISCASLTELTLPGNVKRIGGAAFYGCSCLKTFTVPGNVRSVADDLFSNCNGLTALVLEEGVRSIGEWILNIRSKPVTVTLPRSVTRIKSNAFSVYGADRDYITLRVPPGSYAERFAKKHGLPYILREEDKNGLPRTD